MSKKLLGTVFGLIVIVAILWSGYSSWQSHKPNTSGPRQAIFLANGQVYFGYASDLRNQVVVIKEVYYLKSQATLAPADSKTPSPAATAVDLIKLGDEIYGPTDEMRINRDSILHVEDMKKDSQVNQKITEYLNKK